MGRSFVAASGQILVAAHRPATAKVTSDVVGNELGWSIERRFLEEEPASVPETGKAAHPILNPGRSGAPERREAGPRPRRVNTPKTRRERGHR